MRRFATSGSPRSEPVSGSLQRLPSLVRSARLSTKLVLFTTAATALVLSTLLMTLTVGIRRDTEQLLVEELGRSETWFLRHQERNLTELLLVSSLITQNTTLRAAIDTYRLEEKEAAGGPRDDLLATIQNEVDKTVAGLRRDLLIVTDERAIVLAASERAAIQPRIGADLSALPLFAKALDPDPSIGKTNFGVVSFAGEHFLVGCLPVELQGYVIGTLTLGDRIDRVFSPEFQQTVGGEILVAVAGRILLSSLPEVSPEDAQALVGAAADSRGEGAPPLRLGPEDYAITALSLGINEAGEPITLYLLRSLTRALTEPGKRLFKTLLSQAALAMLVAGLATWGLARAGLRPLEAFVAFMKNVEETGDYSRRFSRGGMDPLPPGAVGRDPATAGKHWLELMGGSYEVDLLVEAFDGMMTEIEARDDALRTAQKGLEDRVEERSTTLRQEVSERAQAEKALRQSEERLLQSQKMEAVGLLAGGVAHDFNNILTGIMGLSQLAQENLSAENPARADIEQIIRASERGASLTEQLLACGSRQVLTPKVLDLNAVVGSLGRLLSRVIGEDIELVTKLDPDLWAVRADPAQIERVVLNLAVNSKEAIAGAGKVTLQTVNVELASHEGASTGRYVMLAVSDTGHGMDAETQSRVFEPFFTTESNGKRSGLGLSTVYGIVKQSGGFVRVASVPDEGASFRVFLPCAEQEVELQPERSDPQVSLRGSETILVVEDEAFVRRIVAEVLRSKGYDVLEAAHPREALAIVQHHRNPIDLLVSDVIMPEMNGRELYERAAIIRSDLNVLFMSGYAADAIGENGMLEREIAFITKPFATNALAAKVRQVLDTHTPSIQ